MLGNNVWEGPLAPGKADYDSVDLGDTQGDSVLTVDKDFKELIAANRGTKPYDYVETGKEVMVTVPMTNYSIAQLQKVLSGSALGSGSNTMRMGASCYQSLYANAKTLILKRVGCDNDVSADEDYWVTFPKAHVKNESDVLNFSPDTEQVLEVVFIVFRDRDVGSASNGYWFYSGAASTALA